MAQKTFLVIEAHADDAAIGAGALLIEAARKGHRVVIVTVVSDFSTWGTSIGREKELKQQMISLSDEYGFERIFLDRPYHQTDASDLALKQELAEIYLSLDADTAFIHHSEDLWPDHTASAKLAQDALLFPHGLTQNKSAKQCPLVYAFDISPRQTYSFNPDVYYDVSHMIKDYMELILRTAGCYFGKPEEDILVGRFHIQDEDKTELRLCSHGLKRFADCVRFGNIAQYNFALGFRTVWGKRDGVPLF
jgi:LmbE family N-acetylglucosaminyl deacetylase